MYVYILLSFVACVVLLAGITTSVYCVCQEGVEPGRQPSHKSEEEERMRKRHLYNSICYVYALMITMSIFPVSGFVTMNTVSLG